VDAPSVGLGVALLAGVLSFLSPCVLPLVPSYVSFLTGLTLEDMEHRRRVTVSHALAFVTGFTIIFVILGASATTIGRLFNYYQVWIERAGGALIIMLALYLLGVLRLPGLAADRRVHLADKPVGYLGSVLVGVAFGAGWTPCLGPILAAILLFASATETVGQGMLLLFAYSMGLAIPFLLAALAVDQFLVWFQGFRKYLPWVMRIAGVMLLIVGILLISGYFSLLATWLQGFTPDFIRRRL
jgi:cytochrome c-type biogenesis protein